MSVVIQVEDLSKQYRLGTVGKRSLSHDVNRWWHKARGKEDPYLKIGQENDRASKGNSDYVWSLRNVNFEVKEGEVLGIIGRNGAGKSTLLKILSKVTAPTIGNVKLCGRVASLLEVGTGFHPELSGRDNIFLNGAILGMTRNEISRKFDEIVDFAGVERYIDTPVKRYSSGMYVRLAFAVAAHLEPEILIVDEVLAVGDAEFQKKCLGKMRDVSTNEGRTILFVSHNLSAVENLCTKGIVLEHGKLCFSGSVSDAVNKYVNLGNSKGEGEYVGAGVIKKATVQLIPNDQNSFTIKVDVSFKATQPIKNLVLGIVIKDYMENAIVGVNNKHYINKVLHAGEILEGSINATFPHVTFLQGPYKIDLFLGDSLTDIDKVENALSFAIENAPYFKTTTALDVRLNKYFIEDVKWSVVPQPIQ